jgi:hypothetical protein
MDQDQEQEQEQEQGQGLAASFEAGCLAMFRKRAFLRATRAPLGNIGSADWRGICESILGSSPFA